MPKKSAGLLLYRQSDKSVEVFLVHPGGPFWIRKDDGAWSIPKGEFADGEDDLFAHIVVRVMKGMEQGCEGARMTRAQPSASSEGK